ncbi:hypothetical protein HZH66_005180 [Vespula vulgaris]|nr:hypothetical protein HZH66_005180 [Vespula vulgaris]
MDSVRRLPDKLETKLRAEPPFLSTAHSESRVHSYLKLNLPPMPLRFVSRLLGLASAPALAYFVPPVIISVPSPLSDLKEPGYIGELSA